MGIILDDNFNSDAIGSQPAGWIMVGNGGNVVDFGVPPPHSGDNRCVGLKGSIQQGFPSTASGVASFSYLSTELGILSTMMNLKSTGAGGTFNLISLLLEHDFSFSAVTISGYLQDINTLSVANSNIVKGFWSYPKIFDFFEVIFNVVENGDHTIQVSVTLVVNGHQVFNATANSGLSTLTQCPALISTIEFVNSTTGFPGAYVDNVVVDNNVGSGYPYPGTPTTFYGQLSQIAVEHLDLPSAQNIRLSQLAIERLDLPSDENIRLSQIVIEVLHGKAPVPAGGWHVKEM